MEIGDYDRLTDNDERHYLSRNPPLSARSWLKALLKNVSNLNKNLSYMALNGISLSLIRCTNEALKKELQKHH